MGICNGNIMLYLFLLREAGGIHGIRWIHVQFTVSSYYDKVEGCSHSSGVMVTSCCPPLLLERSHKFVSGPDK